MSHNCQGNTRSLQQLIHDSGIKTRYAIVIRTLVKLIMFENQGVTNCKLSMNLYLNQVREVRYTSGELQILCDELTSEELM